MSNSAKWAFLIPPSFACNQGRKSCSHHLCIYGKGDIAEITARSWYAKFKNGNFNLKAAFWMSSWVQYKAIKSIFAWKFGGTQDWRQWNWQKYTLPQISVFVCAPNDFASVQGPRSPTRPLPVRGLFLFAIIVLSTTARVQSLRRRRTVRSIVCRDIFQSRRFPVGTTVFVGDAPVVDLYWSNSTHPLDCLFVFPRTLSGVSRYRCTHSSVRFPYAATSAPFDRDGPSP